MLIGGGTGGVAFIPANEVVHRAADSIHLATPPLLMPFEALLIVSISKSMQLPQ